MNKNEAEQQIQNYLDDLLLNNLSSNTIDAYTFDLYDLLKFLDDKNLKLNARTLKSYVADLYKRDMSTSTIRRRVHIISRVFSEIMPKINVKGDKHLPDIFDRNEIKAIRAELKTHRDRMAFDIMVNTGIRISELVGLNANDIAKQKIKIRGKGKKDRTVFLPKEIYSRYEIDFDGTSKPLFTNNNNQRITSHAIRDSFQAAAKSAGLNKHFTPHSLRHSFATELLRKGVGIYSVAKLLGHSNIATTTNYLRLADIELESEFTEKWKVI